jgi:hypothetical protein
MSSRCFEPETSFLNWPLTSERDPDYKFTKNLPKKCDGFTHHDIEFACQVPISPIFIPAQSLWTNFQN